MRESNFRLLKENTSPPFSKKKSVRRRGMATLGLAQTAPVASFQQEGEFSTRRFDSSE
jgi:hypothetical protein